MSDLAQKYRPKRFSDIRCQELAVDWCRNQIGTKKGQSVLLSGPFGAGKTSLALTYANARFCLSPAEDMSPCGSCPCCKEFGARGENFMEFTRLDCGENSRVERVTELADTAKQSPFGSDWRVFFLDEVHNLSPRGFDALLKVLETKHKWGPTVILATTKIERVPLTIRSRIKELELRLFSTQESRAYLRDICERERLSFDPEALELLSAVGGGHARDLIKHLEQVSEFGSITTANVRRTLRLDFTDILTSYVTSLAAGDLQAQLDKVEEWQEEPKRKLDYIHRYLTFAYLNNSLGLVRPDPLFNLSDLSTRMAIQSEFVRRAEALRIPINAFWEGLLRSLSPAEHMTSSALLTRITEAHFLVNGAPNPLAMAPATDRNVTGRPRFAGPGVARLRADKRPPETGRHLTRRQISQIYHAASFLPQHYGTLFNLSLSVHNSHLLANDHTAAFGFASDLVRSIRDRIDYRIPDNGFHWLRLHECDEEGGVVTKIAAYVVPEFLDDVTRWIRAKFLAKRFPSAPEDAVLIDRVSRDTPGGRLEFHWSSVRSQMRGLDPSILERSETGQMRPLVELLGIPLRLRAPTGGAGRKALGTSESLAPGAQSKAAAEKMAFLSALDDRAWPSLYGGWELVEHKDRAAERERRADEEHKRLSLFEGASNLHQVQRENAIKQLLDSFPENPRLRQRTWSGWWVPEIRSVGKANGY